MRIVVKTYSGGTAERPESSWDRSNEDVVLGEPADYTPVLFARIAEEPAGFDGIGFGIFLHCDGQVDSTTFLPFPLYHSITLGQPGNTFILRKNGRRIYSSDGQGGIELLRKFIASQPGLQPGDIVAVELQAAKPLIKRHSRAAIRATYCGNTTLDINIEL